MNFKMKKNIIRIIMIFVVTILTFSINFNDEKTNEKDTNNDKMSQDTQVSQVQSHGSKVMPMIFVYF